MPRELTKKQFNYLQALNTLDFYFEGYMIPYILLGETAIKMKNQEDLTDLEKLEIGVDERRLSRYSRNALRDRYWLS